MSKFVVVSCFFLAWAFYEASGGRDFEPEEPARVAKYKAIEAERVEARLATMKQHKAVMREKAEQRRASKAEQPSPQPMPAAQQEAEASVILALLPTTTRSTPPEAPAATGPSLQTYMPDAGVTTPGLNALVSPEPGSQRDLWQVRSGRVNMRDGPGTNYPVTGKLTQSDRAVVLQDPGHGWVQLEVVEGGAIGWVSARLLSPVN